MPFKFKKKGDALKRAKKLGYYRKDVKDTKKDIESEEWNATSNMYHDLNTFKERAQKKSRLKTLSAAQRS